ncbi:MAG: TRAP transporter small permease subunit [Pseudomonadota bacterium]
MGVLLGLLAPLRLTNDAIQAVCRVLGIVALGVMVLCILIQVFFRYALNDALPWSEEAARFCMLWMTGLMAPIAFRQGGFVAIDMFERALPKILATVLSLALLLLAMAVLAFSWQIGWSEVTGFAGTFKTASLYTFFFPSIGDMNVEFGLEKMPRSHMMASLLVGVALMFLAGVELLLRIIITMSGGGDRLPDLSAPEQAGAE